MYDVIVVGARCAGSPLSMLLARRGYRVLLLDRATFPSDTISGHYIHQPGMQSLKRWGLYDKVAATNCPPLSRIRFDVGDFYLEGNVVPAGDVTDGFCPRRILFDNILVDAATQAGAELREGFSVQELLFEDGRVVGIRGKQKDGSSVVEKAPLVVGADGQHSFVARAVQAKEYNTRPAQTVGYYTYWSGVECDAVELYPRDGRFLVALPTNDGLTQVAVLWSRADFHEYRADIEGNYLRTLALAPRLAERLRDARREERFVGSAETRGFFRKPYGAGWALVGDAGYHKDPITAQGMTDSFRDAEFLAEAIDRGFSGESTIEQALAHYEQRRNEAATAMYEHTCNLAALAPPPPEMQQLLGALRWNQPDTDRFLSTVAGTVSIPGFFSSDNVSRILRSTESLAA